MEVQAMEQRGELRRKRPCDSCPMAIVFPVLRSYKVTELCEKVSTQ